MDVQPEVGNRLTTTVDSELCFQEGELFESYQKFLERLELHSRQDYVYYWRRDSRTIEAASIKKTTRCINPALRYYSLRYTCVLGGQKFEPKSKRRESIRIDCPAFVGLRATKCGQWLVVSAVCNSHNHEIGPEVSKKLSQGKKLSPEMKREVQTLLLHSLDKTLLKEYVRLKEQKELSTKDLINLTVAARKQRDCGKLEFHKNQTARLTKHVTNFVRKNSDRYDSKLPDESSSLTDIDSQGIEMLEERLMDLDGLADQDTQESQFSTLETAHCQIETLENFTIKHEVVELTPEPKIERKRSRWKNSTCLNCYSRSRILIRSQIDVLRARKDKLKEETNILRLQKQKLKLELKILHETAKII
ncbi:uncharacterized protein LOC129747641 [Uranotaenia lowii]|uniref:uncharacterized protein LOC129747641 n=1 Tax=Uranotaenia lowii TaxID=190385 RepID=UPI00247A4FC4|nr:uncharacterized protein LOC129747641 [Uranotaenia lowii]